MEATLFGYERGAFTGAVSATPGLFEEADGGTLFIDEIGDLDITLQSKLLRAIERSEIRRIGGKSWFRVDVRIMAATRRDLDREVPIGRFATISFSVSPSRASSCHPSATSQGHRPLGDHFWKEMGGAQALSPATC